MLIVKIIPLSFAKRCYMFLAVSVGVFAQTVIRYMSLYTMKAHWEYSWRKHNYTFIVWLAHSKKCLKEISMKWNIVLNKLKNLLMKYSILYLNLSITKQWICKAISFFGRLFSSKSCNKSTNAVTLISTLSDYVISKESKLYNNRQAEDLRKFNKFDGVSYLNSNIIWIIYISIFQILLIRTLQLCNWMKIFSLFLILIFELNTLTNHLLGKKLRNRMAEAHAKNLMYICNVRFYL